MNQPHRYFCTLFDKGFLTRGLALYNSLEKQYGDNFTFWVLCMDDLSREILEKLKLRRVKILTLDEFEDEELRAAKKSRAPRKYCFTLSPCLPLYILEHNDIDMVSYIDGDLYFFSSPEVIFDEMGSDSIMIIPHRIGATRKEKEKEVGKYNVGMLSFRKDANALECLRWWRKQCILFCTDIQPVGYYDDQKFLDEFETRFKGVCVLKNTGANLAPWNIELKEINVRKGEPYTGNDKLVFFHFSSFKLYPYSSFLPFGPYSFHEYTRISLAKKVIYRPYAKKLYEVLERVRKIQPNWNYGMADRPGTEKSAHEFFENSVYFPARRLAKKVLGPVLKMIK